MEWNFGFFLLKCFYLMLPAYFANMAPVIVKKINFLAYPVDFNKKFGKKPILGKNKTFRGIFFGILFSVIIAYAQFLIEQKGTFPQLYFFGYQNWFLAGFLMGVGALLGDLVKSFFKRRIGIEPGSRWVPFDQTDFVVGALFFSMFVFEITFEIFAVSILLSFALHIVVNHIAFYTKIRKEKW